LSNSSERGIDGIEEVHAQPRPFVFVPKGGVFRARPRLQAQGGKGDSSFGQPTGNALAHVVPRFAV
jgi:hypothetical protein